ncbi:uncharacterized protein LOC129410741 [Boleophthalmus pectinirostris]|uniref:uncharacterized protein LOC129410741 n=1 Tax=Boleophthalmus pectinirostris TaxID=150288 RepID=UPI00242B2A8F|nr:uncharacterized protein LOC129410741 [Boleophthalmus pectinirostris]
MTSGLCDCCLFCECAANVKSVFVSAGQRLFVFCRNILQCSTCFENPEDPTVLQLNENKNELCNDQNLETLRRLAASENPKMQQTAAEYFLNLSKHLISPLPDPYLGPVLTLLYSPDLKVQKTTAISLINFLLKDTIYIDTVVDMKILEPLIEMFKSGDAVAQCTSCACIIILSSSESKADTIMHDGIIPLLALAKSYDPQVQQDAAWALLQLTQSESSTKLLCQCGALPVLVLLLQSSNSKLQFLSCTALYNIASVQKLQLTLLNACGCFLIRSLVNLMSSTVTKNAAKACQCLQLLAHNVQIQAQLMELDCVLPLKTLLRTSSLIYIEPALTLLCTMSSHAPNKDVLVGEGVLDVIGQLFYCQNPCPTLVICCSSIISHLSNSDIGPQAITNTMCVSGLLTALENQSMSDEALLQVTSCLQQLLNIGTLRSHVVAQVASEHIARLVNLSEPTRNPVLSCKCAAILSKFKQTGKLPLLTKFY